MWWESVNTGGDSPARAQVSDNAGGFGRLTSTAASPDRHGKLSRGKNFISRPARAAVPECRLDARDRAMCRVAHSNRRFL